MFAPVHGAMKDAQTLRMQATDRQVFQMAIPIGFALLVPQFNYLINSIFLGMLGPGMLGIAGITGVYYLVFAAIGYGLHNGLQALIARRAGQDRSEEIGVLSVQSLYVASVVAALGIMATYFIAPILLESAIRKDLFVQTMSFLRIRIWGLPFLYAFQMRNGFLVGTNQSRLLIWGTLAETVANITLDYCLIFGKAGLPRLGFNGAAYASVASEAIGMIVIFGMIQLKGLSKRFRLYKDLKLHRSVIRLILSQSAPLIAQFAISIMSWEFFFILLSRYGDTALDLSQYMRVMIGFLGVFVWSFASTANTMVSNIIGQGRKNEVVPLIHRIIRLSFITSLVFSIPLMIFPEFFLGIVRSDQAFIAEGVPVVRVVAAAMVMMSVSTIWLNAVTGTGNTAINLGIETLTVVAYVFYVHMTMEVYMMPVYIGWMSEWLYWICMYGMSRMYILSGHWQKKDI